MSINLGVQNFMIQKIQQYSALDQGGNFISRFFDACEVNLWIKAF